MLLVVTTVLLLVSVRKRPRMPPNITQHTGQAPTPKQRILWDKVPMVPKLRNLVFTDGKK